MFLFHPPVTTADGVALGPTVHAPVPAHTAVVCLLADTHLHPFSLTWSPRAVTTAATTPRPSDAIATVEVLVTRGNARALVHDPVHQSKWTGSARENGNGKESEIAPPTTCPQRNTNMSAEVTAATEGRGPGPTTGTERGSAATRANTTAAVDTQDTVVTAAETLGRGSCTRFQETGT